MEESTQMGTARLQGPVRAREGYVDLAVEEGATVAYGGEQPANQPGGCFIEPTVLTDVENDMRVVREEIFGPVLAVIPFSSEAEAIAIANGTDYGLAAGIWTNSLARAHRVAGGPRRAPSG